MPSLAEALRGDPERRTVPDIQLADSLKTQLGAIRLATDLRVHARDVRQRDNQIVAMHRPIAAVRGAMVKESVRLLALGHRFENHFADALDAWRATGPSSTLLDAIKSLDREEREQLKTEVTAHLVVLESRLRAIPSGWRPRFRQGTAVRCGHVEIRDVVDLAVGSTHTLTTSVALLDVTTSPLDDGAERVLRFHALAETIRSARAPWRVVLFSTLTDELQVLEVTPEQLQLAVDDVTSVVAESK
jgi:hypothetical protein